MSTVRDLARDAYQHTDTRLRAQEKAEPGLRREELQTRAMALFDEWVALEGTRQVAQGRQPLNRAAEQQIRQVVMRRLFGLGDLEPLLSDDDIENVHITGCDVVWVDPRSGPPRRLDYEVAESDEELIALIQRLAAREGIQERRWDPAHPILDLTLRDGSRLLAVREVVRRPTVTIRLHRLVHLTLEDLVRTAVFDERGAEWLRAAVQARQSVLISGETGAGKTALLRCAALGGIAPTTRVVTIEDTYEIFLDRVHPNCVAMQARPANVEGRGRVDAADLFSAALRMAPGVLIVGEVRYPEQAEPMLDATSAGGAGGSLSTIHGRSPRQALGRLQNLALRGPSRVSKEASADLIVDAVDFVVQIVALRDAAGRKHRRITAISEITDARDGRIVLNDLFRRGMWGPMTDVRREVLAEHGYDHARWASREELSA